MDIKEPRMNQIIDDIRKAMIQFPEIARKAYLPDDVIDELNNNNISWETNKKNL